VESEDTAVAGAAVAGVTVAGVASAGAENTAAEGAAAGAAAAAGNAEAEEATGAGAVGIEKAAAPVGAAATSEAATEVFPKITGESPPAGVLVGVAAGGVAARNTQSFIRRHPWMTTALGLVLVLVCGGAALALTSGPAGGPPGTVAHGAALGGSPSNGTVVPVSSNSSQTPSAPQTAASQTPGSPSSTLPAGGPSASGTPGASPSAPSAPSASGTPSASAKPSTKPSTKPSKPPTATPTPTTTPTLPMLPKTGIHPIRQMIVVAFMLLAAGIVLMFVFRRRPEDEVQ
jgi:hypothetical protein